MVKQVASWLLKSILGHGSFGEVFYAVNKETDKKAAIKVCTKQSLAKGQGRTLLQREIATMKSLDHKNVLKLYEVLETTKRFYLVMELVTGGEMFNLIQDNKRFDEVTARKYFVQLIDGLHYCHEQGIVHRDLKPQNLLLTDTDTLKIADFGFSRFQECDQDGNVTKSLRLQTQCGTPNYAAPEIFLGQGYDGFKTDTWSCGVILYVMLCGHVPFKAAGGGGGLQGVIMSIVQGRYSIPTSLSPDAQTLIKSILVTDPNSRITVAGVLSQPWLGLRRQDFSIPRIVVSDDQVRNSIVVAGEEEEVTVLTDASEIRPKQKPAPVSSIASPPSFSSPSTTTSLQSGGYSSPPNFESALSSTLGRGLDEISENKNSTSPISATPKSPISESTRERQKRARGATFTTLNPGTPLNVASLGSLASPTQNNYGTEKAIQLDPEVEKLLVGSLSHKASFDQLGRPNHSPRSTLPESPTNMRTQRAAFADVVGDAAKLPLTRTSHIFKRKHWHTPHWCFYCGKFIYGVGKQGFSCINCDCPVHIKCVDLASQNSCCEQFKARMQKGNP